MYTKTRTIILNSKPLAGCRSYSGQAPTNISFLNCAKKEIWESLRGRINCTVATMTEFVALEQANELGLESPIGLEAPTGLAECKTASEARYVIQVYLQVLESFQIDPESYRCHLPCERTGFEAELKYFYDRTLGNPIYFFSETDCNKIVIVRLHLEQQLFE